MKLMPMIIHSLVLLAGLIVLYIAWLQFQKTQKLISSGVTAIATVIENVPETRKGQTTWRPKFQYMNQEHNHTTFMGELNTAPPAWSIGETTLIVYIPNQPGSARIISYWNLYRTTILITAGAAPLVVIGLGYFLYFLYSRNLMGHLS